MHSLKDTMKDFKILLRSVPSMVTAAFVLSVVLMNLLASRELYRSDYFCLNCGLALSWISFLCMDCVCRRFGPKAANELSVFAILINLFTAVMIGLLMKTPGRWAAYYSAGDSETAELISAGIDQTFSSAWYVVAGSSLAMFASTLVNTALNHAIGKRCDNGTYKGFAARSLLSTCVAQFVDNFVFSALVSHVFFGWNWTQVVICSLTSMIIELAFEAMFSPLGYRISKAWEQENVGITYLREMNVGGNAA
ncbi:MAG: VUT family protein [Solobacterium sp.]|nr:VUT family protein [Solobacterium sp.]MBR2793122.1 VUT family protein [Solobacterium sp.]